MAEKKDQFLKAPAMNHSEKLIHNANPRNLGKILDNADNAKASQAKAGEEARKSYFAGLHVVASIIEAKYKTSLSGAVRILGKLAEAPVNKLNAALIASGDDQTETNNQQKSNSQATNKDTTHATNPSD